MIVSGRLGQLTVIESESSNRIKANMEAGQRLWDAGVFFSTAPAIRAIQADSITPSDFLDSIVGWRSAEGERDVHGGDDGAGPRSTHLSVQPVVLRCDIA